MVETEQAGRLKRIIVPMPDALIAELEDYRYEAHRPSQAEAVRELMRIGLETWRQQGKPERKRPGKGDAS